MSEHGIYPVQEAFKKSAHIDEQKYQEMYKASIESPETFWAEQASNFLVWDKKWKTVKNTNFTDPKISWFEGGQLNACYNAVDKHLPERAQQVAFIWEQDDPTKQAEKITYQKLYEQVCKMANVLKRHGVKKGDRVCLYMPMVPEAIYAMLACARLGAVHSVVFAGFSAEALKNRIVNSDADIVITADEGLRGGKTIPLKKTVDAAIEDLESVSHVLMLKKTGAAVNIVEGRDVILNEELEQADTDCPCVSMESNDPLFILYTSGSTGTPKGVLHGTGGYLLYAAMTHKYVFDYQEGDTYWCTADVGWITGHSYIVYGPLINGATSVIYEGIPTYPDAGRFWSIIEKHKVNSFYTAPTAIRALYQFGDAIVQSYDRSSLRVLGSVGEPINPEAWEWYYNVVGESRCPIVDTWWQTETGGILITPLVGAMSLKPGSALRPFFGVQPILVNDKGEELQGEAEGILCIKDSWPGQMQTVFRNHRRFKDTYFSTFDNLFFSGDGAKRDADGDLWITGRVDDVLNVSGHRLGTAELESALVEHKKVSEAAVVGIPHDVKGEGIYAYVTLHQGQIATDSLKDELIQLLRSEIGPIATPESIHWAPNLPKTRSGKIMRRILRKIASKQEKEIGDTSTLADQSVIEELLRSR